jgi:hypothetical protein
MVYNKSAEPPVLHELANAFPDYAPQLLSMAENVVDLMEPFAEKAWYCRELHGKWTIKKVGPAFAPELDYGNLENVNNASDAPRTFLALPEMDASERETKRKALLSYCERDSWSMVVIFSKLREMI